MAVQGVLANRLRSLLTLLGITIGVASVIILVAVGRGSATSVQTPDRGARDEPADRPGRRRGSSAGAAAAVEQFTFLTMKDVKALSDKTVAPDIKSVSPVVNGNSVTATRGVADGDARAGDRHDTVVRRGPQGEHQPRAPSSRTQDETNHARVAVIGTTVVQNLFGTTTDPLGQTIPAERRQLPRRGRAQVEGLERDPGPGRHRDRPADDRAGPTRRPQRPAEPDRGRGDSRPRRSTTPRAEATAILTPNHSNSDGTAAFSILSQSSLLQTTSASKHTFTVLLAAVAAISLLVGGIGVMNIMLVTVTERTREIGIRKAIGARKADILGQFLTEAVLLSILGGITGVVAGLVGGQFKIVGVQPVIEPYSVVLALGVGVAVGLFFGIYPANRAASLRPIEALRYE